MLHDWHFQRVEHWFCEIKKKLAYFSTIVIFCYYQLHNPNLLVGGNTNTNFGCHTRLDGGAVSALAIGAVSPRHAPVPASAVCTPHHTTLHCIWVISIPTAHCTHNPLQWSSLHWGTYVLVYIRIPLKPIWHYSWPDWCKSSVTLLNFLRDGNILLCTAKYGQGISAGWQDVNRK